VIWRVIRGLLAWGASAMRAPELGRLVASNLRRMKARVAMTAAGVVIGTAAILLLISLGAGLQRSATESIVSVASLTELRVMSSGQEDLVLNNNAVEEFRAMDGVAEASPLQWSWGGGTVKLGNLEGYASITGIESDAMEGLGFVAEKGDLHLGSGQVVVGARISNTFTIPAGAPRRPARPTWTGAPCNWCSPSGPTMAPRSSASCGCGWRRCCRNPAAIRTIPCTWT
jgi:putative ABC transport system permease protein